MRSRKRIFQATLDIIRADGFDAVSVSSVARGAKASRQAIYRNFPTVRSLISESIADLLLELQGELGTQTHASMSPLEFIVELVVAARNSARADPLLTKLLAPSPGNPMFEPDMMRCAHEVTRRAFYPLLQQDQQLEWALDAVVAITLRLGVSVIHFPDPATQDDDALRTFLRRWIGPALPSEWQRSSTCHGGA